MLSAFLASAAGGAIGLLWGRWARFFLLPIALLLAAGSRAEWAGVAASLLVLSLEPGRGRLLPLVQEAAAALLAVACGFRIDVLTDPAGGYVALRALSVPLSVVFVLLVLRAREGLRRVVPRPGPQFLIDLVLVGNALLFAALFPQGARPAALLLPFLLLGGVAAEAIVLWRGAPVPSFHRALAFALALSAIRGAAKGPLSLALLAPLVLTSLPLLTTVQALVSQGWVGERSRSLPRFLAARGHTPGSVSVLLLLLSTGLALGAALVARHSGGRALFAAGAVPLVLLLHFVRARTLLWIRRGGGVRTDGRFVLFGVPLDPVTHEEALRRVEGMVAEAGAGHVIVTPNSTSVLRSRAHPSLAEAYRRASLVVADGVGVVWASRLLRTPVPERVTGIDLASALLARAAQAGWRVGLLGGKDGVARRAAQRLTATNPGLKVVWTHSGYFDGNGPLDEVRRARPDVLLVGMGVPRQETWMERNRGRLGVPVMIGVGGTLDVLAGDLSRAPRLWRCLGLEWLFRLLREPRRIKEALSIPRFMAEVLAARVAAGVLAVGRLPDEG